MEDDFEEYWAAIRPAPKPSMKDLRDELLKIAKLREEEWDLMTHRNIPPPPEGLFEGSRGGIPLVVNLGDPTSLDDAATREYVLQTYSESQPFHIDGNGSIRVDQEPLSSLQIQSTGIQLGHQPIVTDGPLSGGGQLLVAAGSGLQASWGHTHQELRLDLPNNEDFRSLQNNTDTISSIVNDLLGRVNRIEQENRDLRARLSILEFGLGNRQ
jgi:hypothetical protein